MTLLKECVENKKFDSRILEKNLARGYLSEKEVEDFLGKLPDDSANAAWVKVEELTGDDDRPSNSAEYRA